MRIKTMNQRKNKEKTKKQIIFFVNEKMFIE
jgi:hypothetical protein